MAKKSDKYKEIPSDVQNLMKEARTVMEDVLKRVETSSKKYGAAYVLADISEELNQEILDAVGWPLLEAVRIRLLLSHRLAKLDNKYLEMFLKYHDTDYLKMLRGKIDLEIIRRAKN